MRGSTRVRNVGAPLIIAKRCAVIGRNPVSDAAFDPLDRIECAMTSDIGRFRRPRRNRSQAWHDKEQCAEFVRGLGARAVSQQALQAFELILSESAPHVHEMPEFGCDAHPRNRPGQGEMKFFEAERREGCAAPEAYERHYRRQSGWKRSRERVILPDLAATQRLAVCSPLHTRA